MAQNEVSIRFTAVDAATDTVRKITQSFGSLTDAVRPATAALGALGVTFSAGAVVAAIRSTADALDRLNDAAEETGVAVDALAGLRYAAIFSGQAGDVLDKALIKLNGRIAETAAGGKEAADMFRKLDISVTDLAGNALPTDEVLAKIADRFASYRDGAEKSALASALFGEKVGPKLLPLLNQGSEGIARLREEAERLGVALSPEKVAAAAKFNDAVDRLGQQFVGLRNAIFADLLPAITELLDDMERGTRIFGSFGSALANIGLGTNPFATIQTNIESVQQQIERLRVEQNRFRDEFGQDTDAGQTRKALQGEIELLEKRLQYLKETQRVRALQGAGGVLDARDARARGSGGRAPVIGGATAGGAADQLTEQQRALASYVQGLERALQATQNLSESEKVAAAIRTGVFGEVTPQLRQTLMLLAERVDAERALQEIEKQGAEQRKREDAERLQQQQRIAEWERSLIDQTRERFSRQGDLFLDEADRLNRWRTEQLQIAIDASEARLIEEDEYQRRRLEIEALYAAESANIEARRYGAAQAYRALDLKSAGAFFGAMSGLMNTNSRKMFEVGKAAAIGETIINTYSAAMAAYKSLASIPVVGPALGAAAAAAAIATGIANVQRIKSTAFGGGGSASGSVPAGNVATPGQGPFNVGPSSLAGGDRQRPQSQINITLTGDGMYSAESVRRLIERINEQAALGVRIVTTTA